MGRGGCHIQQSCGDLFHPPCPAGGAGEEARVLPAAPSPIWGGGSLGGWRGWGLTKYSSRWTRRCCRQSPCWLRGWQSHGAAHPIRRTGCPCQASSGPRRTAYTTGPSCPETLRLCKKRLEHRAGTRVGW